MVILPARWLLLLTASWVLPAFVASAQAYRTARQTIEAWEEMWNHRDVNAVAHLFANDSSVTYYSSEYPGLFRGIKNLYRHHERFGFIPGGKASPDTLWLDQADYRYFGKICVVTATWLFRKNGSDRLQRGPVTFVLLRSSRGWRIVHAHFSNDP